MTIPGYQWKTSGIIGAGFQNTVAIDPRNNGVVLSGADVSGIHRSADWGDLWVTSNVGLYATTHLCVAGFRFSIANPDVVLAAIGRRGSGGGLFVSLDNGRTWALMSTTPQFSGANNLAPLPTTHPRSTGNVLAWDESDNLVYAGTYDGGVMRAALNAATGTGGTSWTTLGLAGKYIRSIVRADQDTLFAATYDDKVYRLTGIRGASPTATKLTNSPAKPEELAIIGSHIYCVSSDVTDGGVWRAALATPTAWTKINDANVDTSSARWLSVDGYANSADGKHHVWIGCVSPDPSTGQYRPSVMRCLDAAAASPAWSSVTSNGTYVHPTVAGPAGKQWWLLDDQPTMAIGRGSYVAAQLAISPDRTRMFSAGRSGMWRTPNPVAANPDWYPVVDGMAVTICRDVAADPNVPGVVYVDNTDWVFFASVDHGTTVDQNRPSPNTGFAIAADPQSSKVVVASGDRDTSTLGKVWSADTPASGAWTDEQLNSGGGGTAVAGGDNFGRTTVAGSWGNTSVDNKAYALSKSGNLDDTLPLVTAGVGSVGLTPTPNNSAGGSMVTRLGTGASGPALLALTSPKMVGRFRFTADAAGGAHYGGLVVLGQWANTWGPGANSYYEARVQQNATTGKPKVLRVFRSDGGTLVQINTDTNIDTAYGAAMPAGGWLWMRHEAVQNGGNVDLYVKVWDDGAPEPDTWSWTGTDNAANRITQAGGLGTKSGFNASYTANAAVEYDDFDWVDAVTTGGSGGLRPLGVGAATPSGSRIIVAAVENDGSGKGGIWRKVGSTWTQLAPALLTGQGTKTIPVDWPPQSATAQYVWIFDRADGVYRSSDNGASWTRIWARTSNSESTGYVAYDPAGQVLYVSAGGSLYRIDNATTCAADAAAPQNLGLSNVGPVAVDANGHLYAARKVASAMPPALLVSEDHGATFVDVADATYQGSAGIPFSMSVGPDGYVYVALNGNGMLVGKPGSSTPPPPPPPPGGGGGGGIDVRDHPRAGVYRLFAADLVGGVRAEIPYATLDWSEQLDKPGGIKFTASTVDPAVARWTLDPGRTALYVDRSGRIVWGGLLWAAKPKSDSSYIEFAGESWTSYLVARLIRTRRWYPQSDPIGIARDLVNAAQTDTAGALTGNVGIAVDYSTVYPAVLHDIDYPENERKPILEAIEKLAELDAGFDFDVVCQWQGSDIVKTLRFWAPTRGQDLTSTLVLRNGETCIIADYQVNTRGLVNRLDLLGAGDGPSQLVSTRVDDSQPGYPILDGAVTYRDIDKQETLDAAAAREIAALRLAPDIGKVTLLADGPVRFGDATLGDTVLVDLDDGYWAWQGRARIAAQDVSVGSGSEQVTWTLADPTRTGASA